MLCGFCHFSQSRDETTADPAVLVGYRLLLNVLDCRLFRHFANCAYRVSRPTSVFDSSLLSERYYSRTVY